MQRLREWGRQPGLVALMTLAWLAATAWMRPLALPDEGRYVGVAWEMLRSGNWLTPTLDGLPYFHKPPLFYWITAGSLSLFGPNAWAGRAAPMLGAWLGAFSLYLFARRWWGERAASFALVALLAQPLWFVSAQYANLDMLVAGCITATILALAHAALCVEQGEPEGSRRAALALAYALAALGLLAKGLIGFVIPAMVMGSWLILRRRWRVLGSMLWLPGMLMFALLAAPWFLAMQLRYPDFLDYFFVVQHFKRFSASGFNNVQPWWFYTAALLVLSLPWLPWLHRSASKGWLADAKRGPVRLLMVLWLLLVVLFFSMPASKLLGYVLPAVPPLALLFADGLLARGEPSARATRLWTASAAVSVVAGVGAVLAFAIWPQRSSHDIAAALATQRKPQEAVFMLGKYYYDLPFYARLQEPVMVVDDWNSPDIRKRDDWRKELADARDFAAAHAGAQGLPVEQASSAGGVPAPTAKAGPLITPEALPQALCRRGASWLVGPASSARSYPFLDHAKAIFTHREVTLWHVDPGLPEMNRALACTERHDESTASRRAGERRPCVAAHLYLRGRLWPAHRRQQGRAAACHDGARACDRLHGRRSGLGRVG